MKTGAAKRKTNRSFLKCRSFRERCLLQHAGGILCKVGNDNVCSCPLDRDERLVDSFLFIKPTVSCGCFNHGIFAAHVVCSCWHSEFCLDPVDNIQVAEGWLHHHYVCPFGNIEGYFPESPIAVFRIHLVGGAVSETTSGISCFPERPVER